MQSGKAKGEFGFRLINRLIWRLSARFQPKDKFVSRKLTQILNVQLKKREYRIPDLEEIKEARGIAVLIRGFGSWPDDQTFAKIEERLQDDQYQIIRYSYHQPNYSHYWPMDTLNEIGGCAFNLNDLIRYITEINKQKQIVIMAHSLGGLVVADWISRITLIDENADLLEKVKRVYIFAAPLFRNVSGFLEIDHPFNQSPYLYPLNFHPPYLRDLIIRFPNIKNYICARDDLGPRRDFSIKNNKDLKGKNDLIDEKVVDASHFEICNDESVVEEITEDLNAMAPF